MSIASTLRLRRRTVVVGAGTFLLHWMVLGWLGANIAGPRGVARADSMRRETVLAELVEQASPQPPAPQPPPLAELEPPPLPKVPLPALPPPAAEADAGPAGLPDADDAIAREVKRLVAAGPTPDAVAEAQPEPAAQEAPPVAQEPAQAAPEARRYKVALPPAAEMFLDVAHTTADGTRWNGEATIGWQRDGSNYRMKVDVGVRVMLVRVNLVVVTSEGKLDGDGFAPLTMTEKRRGRALTATHFNREQNKITFSASQAAYPLTPGAQDKATVPLQLAAIARADPAQLQGDTDIVVGDYRDASVFRFVVVGQEEVTTKLGKVQALHLARPPKPGSYNSRLDIWLAPSLGWYPVQIRNTESSGAVTTQTVNKIVMTETGT